jgi:hypothetical protein
MMTQKRIPLQSYISMNGLPHITALNLSVGDVEFRGLLSSGCHLIGAVLQSHTAEKVGITSGRFERYYNEKLYPEGYSALGPLYMVPIHVVGLDDRPAFQVPTLVSDFFGFSMISTDIFLKDFSLRFDPPSNDTSATVTFLEKAEGKIKYPNNPDPLTDTFALFDGFPAVNVSFGLPENIAKDRPDEKIEAGILFLDTSFSPFAGISLLADHGCDITLDQYWEKYPKKLVQTKFLYSPSRLIPTTLTGGDGEVIGTFTIPTVVAEKGQAMGDANLISGEWLIEDGHRQYLRAQRKR